MKRMQIKKALYIFLGSTALALGAIGIFLPVLPTTPFLLLAGFFYLRSSKRLYQWLINHGVFGTYIYNYMTYKSITKRTKIGALLFLWCSLILSMLLLHSLHLLILLAIIGVAVSIHLITLKTLHLKDMPLEEPKM